MFVAVYADCLSTKSRTNQCFTLFKLKLSFGIYFKSMKKIIVITSLLLMTACSSSKKISNVSNKTKICDCPEMKVVNRMPVVGDKNSKDAIPRAYYIYKGERREMDEFDSKWVDENCDVPVREVF